MCLPRSRGRSILRRAGGLGEGGRRGESGKRARETSEIFVRSLGVRVPKVGDRGRGRLKPETQSTALENKQKLW